MELLKGKVQAGSGFESMLVIQRKVYLGTAWFSVIAP